MSAPRAASTGAPAAGAPQTADQKRAKIDEVEQQVNDTKKVLEKTVQATLERGEAINTLETKADQIVVNAAKFKETSAEVKNMFCKKHFRNMAIIVVILAVRRESLFEFVVD
jgi:hypothetical protein